MSPTINATQRPKVKILDSAEIEMPVGVDCTSKVTRGHLCDGANELNGQIPPLRSGGYYQPYLHYYVYVSLVIHR